MARSSEAVGKREPIATFEPHGIPGTLGRPVAPIHRAFDPDAFREAFWVAHPPRERDLHVAFVADVTLATPTRLVLDSQASSMYRIWVDGALVVDGPLRFAPAVPEFDRRWLPLSAGEHRFAIRAIAEGLTMRTAAPVPAFAWVRLTDDTRPLELEWHGSVLDEMRATGLRVSPLLGWMEWQSHPPLDDWRVDRQATRDWPVVVHHPHADGALGPGTLSDAPLALPTAVRIHPYEAGTYRETYTGYEFDDPAVQFLLADAAPDPGDDVDGTWARYDLDRIRIGRIELTMTCAEPADVTIAYADRLTPEGRPAPVASLSAGPTRFLQHFAVPAGSSRIEPMQSLGARYVEVRVRTGGHVTIGEECFVERDHLGEPLGTFESGDPLLDRIWTVGLDTLRASAEDSLVDSVRERGEWVGDVVTAGLPLLACGWGRTDLVRRALLHAAATARPDGLVSGCGPGELIYLGTFAAQWLAACLEAAEAEGSTELLRELVDVARGNAQALVASIRPDGTHALPWSFVDWGYHAPNDEPDAAVLYHIVRGLRAWSRWLVLLGQGDEASEWSKHADRITAVARLHIGDRYHALTLAEHAGDVPTLDAAPAIERTIGAGFPFDPVGERLRDPTRVGEGVITPYFTNFSVSTLLRAGRGAAVASLWRQGWGWMLERGASTWWEVFDDRWSRCHYWSGAPTWQMTRFGLGLRAGLDELGRPVSSIIVNDLGLDSAHGRVHVPGTGWVDVSWARADGGIDYVLESPDAITLARRGAIERLPRGRNHLILERIGSGRYA